MKDWLAAQRSSNPEQPVMELEILPAEEADMDRLMEIQFSAFENDPYHHALYPGDEYSPEVRADAGKDRKIARISTVLDTY